MIHIIHRKLKLSTVVERRRIKTPPIDERLNLLLLELSPVDVVLDEGID